MLDLVRLSPRLLFPPGGEALYRQIALLTEMGPGDEVLDVACGPGVALEYFVREYGVVGSGVDYDPYMVDLAEKRAKAASKVERLQFQEASLDDLPYVDDAFDVAIGELGLAALTDPAAAVREIVRVTRRMGKVVLVQLVWTVPVDREREEVLVEHLGARPLVLVRWKQILREAGVVDLHVEDWTAEETAFRPQVKMPFPDFAELFSVGEKLRILRRAWRRWGWRGVTAALLREQEVHRLLRKERLLALSLIQGTKWRDPEAVEAARQARKPPERPGGPRGPGGGGGVGEGEEA